ncbi:hypothetical protein H0G86_011938 [Trichoderma simmonsii]|uniref:Uncharacterized protein n=1 Tax=Trichoderma simmonsii TaxID=1491479 RepID=A0A8G0LQE6_9HYPO|nr:hypothetical protein H0G86_011938 [Trichoderma simmonsii]
MRRRWIASYQSTTRRNGSWEAVYYRVMTGEMSLMDWGQVYSSVGVQYYHANIEMPPLATPIEQCDQLHPFHPFRGRELLEDPRTQTQQTSSRHIDQTPGRILRLLVEIPCVLRRITEFRVVRGDLSMLIQRQRSKSLGSGF